MPNVVQARVELDNLVRRNGQWRRLNQEAVVDFPIFGLDYLRDLTIGTYQVNLSPSYVQDKVVRDNDEEFQLNQNINEPGFLRIRLYSRFRNATRHQIFISYAVQDVDNEDRQNDEDTILDYYCICQSGARTLGTCAHVASVLWYLGYARHQENIRYPDDSLLNTTSDAANRVELGYRTSRKRLTTTQRRALGREIRKHELGLPKDKYENGLKEISKQNKIELARPIEIWSTPKDEVQGPPKQPAPSSSNLPTTLEEKVTQFRRCLCRHFVIPEKCVRCQQTFRREYKIPFCENQRLKKKHNIKDAVIKIAKSDEKLKILKDGTKVNPEVYEVLQRSLRAIKKIKIQKKSSEPPSIPKALLNPPLPLIKKNNVNCKASPNLSSASEPLSRVDKFFALIKDYKNSLIKL
ncbi:uncharacterized protein LOC131675349 isoform X2 [Phymastichus coffea]|nr:uncharacterized protein LOC131675349 isoform X2 [Phymastichus coffea]